MKKNRNREGRVARMRGRMRKRRKRGVKRERERARERKNVARAESVDLLLKRPAGNNGHRIARRMQFANEDAIRSAKDHYFIPT